MLACTRHVFVHMKQTPIDMYVQLVLTCMEQSTKHWYHLELGCAAVFRLLPLHGDANMPFPPSAITGSI